MSGFAAVEELTINTAMECQNAEGPVYPIFTRVAGTARQ